MNNAKIYILIAAIPVPFGSTRTLLRIKGKRHEKSKTDKT